MRTFLLFVLVLLFHASAAFAQKGAAKLATKPAAPAAAEAHAD